MQAFSSCSEWGLLLTQCAGSSRSALAPRCSWFSCCGAWASVVAAHQLSTHGSRALKHRLSSCSAWALVAPQHVRFSQTRDWTRVPCMGRWILIHYHQGSPTQYHFLVIVRIQISPVIPQSSLYNLIFSWPAIQFKITYCI